MAFYGRKKDNRDLGILPQGVPQGWVEMLVGVGGVGGGAGEYFLKLYSGCRAFINDLLWTKNDIRNLGLLPQGGAPGVGGRVSLDYFGMYYNFAFMG